MITVSSESEIYEVLMSGKTDFFIAEGIYNMTEYIAKRKRTIRLTYRKKKSQRKYF